jgi:putative FmdB family regulatory protein
MPTYEYACRDCGEHVEVVQSFKEDPLTECGLCQGQLRKVFSAAGIIFKGSGYYVTDSRSAATAASGGGAKDTAKDTKKDTKKASSTSSTGSGESAAKSA